MSLIIKWMEDHGMHVSERMKELVLTVNIEDLKRKIKKYNEEAVKAFNDTSTKMETVSNYMVSINEIPPDSADDFLYWFGSKYDYCRIGELPKVEDIHFKEYSDYRKKNFNTLCKHEHNPNIKYSADQLNNIAGNLIAGRYIIDKDADLFVSQLLRPDYNKPKISWKKTSAELIYLMEKLNSTGKCNYSDTSKIFNKQLKANQKKVGYIDIDKCLP